MHVTAARRAAPLLECRRAPMLGLLLSLVVVAALTLAACSSPATAGSASTWRT